MNSSNLIAICLPLVLAGCSALDLKPEWRTNSHVRAGIDWDEATTDVVYGPHGIGLEKYRFSPQWTEAFWGRSSKANISSLLSELRRSELNPVEAAFFARLLVRIFEEGAGGDTTGSVLERVLSQRDSYSTVVRRAVSTEMVLLLAEKSGGDQPEIRTMLTWSMAAMLAALEDPDSEVRRNARWWLSGAVAPPRLLVSNELASLYGVSEASLEGLDWGYHYATLAHFAARRPQHLGDSGRLCVELACVDLGDTYVRMLVREREGSQGVCRDSARVPVPNSTSRTWEPSSRWYQAMAIVTRISGTPRFAPLIEDAGAGDMRW